MRDGAWSKSGSNNESDGGPLWLGKALQRGKLYDLPMGALPTGFLPLFLPFGCPFDCSFGCSVTSREEGLPFPFPVPLLCGAETGGPSMVRGVEAGGA